MSKGAEQNSLSEKASKELELNAGRIGAFACAERLWERVLTNEERQRLGGDLQTLYRECGTAAGIWKKLRGVSDRRAIIDVARAINVLDEQSFRWLLREIGEGYDDPEETLQAAIGSVALVLVARPRAAYWKGKPIDVDWKRRSVLWNFLWELCRLAKTGAPIDCMDLGESAHPDSVTKKKSRLLNESGFPVELGDRIVPVGTGTQKLDVPPAEIRMFELASVDCLKELTA